MAVRFQLRRDTAANWASANPTMALGEPGVETDTLKVKVGDGVTPWNSLSYSITKDFADLDNTPTTITGYGITDALNLANLSATQNPPSGSGSFSYDNTTGVFTYTPPDLTTLGGDIVGSVFADNSTLLVDGVNALIPASVLSGTATINVTGQVSDISNHDTDALSEGATNLYYTDTRSRSAVSVTDSGGDGSLSYDSNTGVITYTGPSAAEVRAHFSGGTGVTITTGSIAIGQAVGTTDNVTFNTVNADLTGDVTGTVSDISNHDTDALSEGATNLYFTTARIDSHLSGGTGVSYNAGAISIGQAVGTSSNVTFNNITASNRLVTSIIDSSDSSAINFETDVTMNAGLTVGNHILPSSNGNIDLGDSNSRYGNLYLDDNIVIDDVYLTATNGSLEVNNGTVGSRKNILVNDVTANDVTVSRLEANEYFRIPQLSTAQRNALSGVENGALVYNTTKGYIEQYVAGNWTAISALPTISSISPTTFNGESGTTITINGTNFDSGSTVKFIGNDTTEYTAASVSYVSSQQLTATTPVDFLVANEPYDVQVITGAGLQVTLEDALDAGGLATWTTSAGSLGTFDAEETVNITLVATDPEGGDVDYTLTSNSLPSGVTLDGETGVIGGAAPIIDFTTTYNFGITPDDGVNNGAERSFSISVNTDRDDNFNQNVLMLTGDSSSEAVTYSAFDDASTNNLQPLPEGRAHGTSWGPFNDSFAVEFLRSDNEYISWGSSTDFALGTGEFTIEAWIKVRNYDDENCILATGTGGPLFYVNQTSGTLKFRIGGVQDVIISSTVILLNEWYHVAVSRDSNSDIRMFINGVQEGSAVNNTFSFTQSGLFVGAANANEYKMNGYLSNVRMVAGTALYTSNFTPSATSLTAVSGTVLLTCHSYRFVDEAGHALTLNNSPKIVSGPFDPVDGTGSIRNRSNGWVSYPDDAAYEIGSGDFCVEGWFYARNITGQTHLYTWSSPSTGFEVYYSGGNYNGYVGTGSTWLISGENFGAARTNEWQHTALVKTGTTVSFFVNGTRTYTTTYNDVVGDPGARLYVGTYRGSNTYRTNTDISNFRYVTGDDVYDATATTLTVPTSPLTAITGTALLTGQSSGNTRNTGFIDSVKPSREYNYLSNGAVQSSFSPYSDRWSVKFDGDSDWLAFPSNSNYELDGQFTIEWWFNTSNFAVDTFWQRMVCLGIDTAGTVDENDAAPTITFANATNLAFRGAANIVESSASGLDDGNWHHVAFTRDGSNTLRMYIDGTQTDSATYSTTITGASTQGILFGTFKSVDGRGDFDGYLSDFRIVKGSSLYTGASFTPPQEPLTAVTGTVAQAFNNNRFYESVQGNANNVKNGYPKVTSYGPYFQSTTYDVDTYIGSGYFDSSSDVRTMADSDDFDLKNSDFTIEAWVYMTATDSAEDYVWGQYDTNYRSVNLGIIPDSFMRMYANYDNTTSISTDFSDTVVPTNAWTHVVLERTNGFIKAYVNGVASTTTKAVSTNSIANSPDVYTIGGIGSIGGNLFGGYISDFRLTNGTAVYGTDFTPPTSPVTTKNSSVLHYKFANAGLYDNTQQFTLEVAGNTTISNDITKYGTGALYFQGDDDYLLTKETHEWGDEDFTIEMWWYPTSTARQALFHGSWGQDWSIGIDYNGGGSPTLGIWASSSGTNWDLIDADPGGNGIGSETINQNQWNHIAYTRNGTTWTSWVNGVKDVEITSLSGTIANTPARMAIGAWWQLASMSSVHGYIDDFRVTKGIARYTANFTPPTKALPKR